MSDCWEDIIMGAGGREGSDKKMPYLFYLHIIFFKIMWKTIMNSRNGFVSLV